MADTSHGQSFVNPPGVERISPDALDDFGVSTDNKLYWRGAPVSTEHRIKLKSTERWLAIIVAAATAVGAITQVIALFE